jgi:hypothetical protein
MNEYLPWAVFAIGFAQLSVLIASVTAPIQLQFASTFQALPRLHRQLVWCYAAYIFCSIAALGLVCLLYSTELASGEGLARAICIYGAIFWGVRLSLQAVFEVKPYLKNWWLKAGYHTLTVLFASFVAVYAWGIFY